MKITTAESLVMEALWRAGRPLTVEDIGEALADEEWTAPTIRTLLSRLSRKRAVSAVKQGRSFFYTPLIARADYAHAESKHLIDRLFDGKIETFVTRFSERQTLSAEEIARLRHLIERLGDDR